MLIRNSKQTAQRVDSGFTSLPILHAAHMLTHAPTLDHVKGAASCDGKEASTQGGREVAVYVVVKSKGMHQHLLDLQVRGRGSRNQI
jgi:hypothetical protein